MRTWEKALWPLLTVGMLLASWQGAVSCTHTRIFPTPLEVLLGLEELIRRGLLLGYIRDSLARVSAGYLAAAVLGIPIGLLLGRYAVAAEAFSPLIQMMRPISPLAWSPLAVVWFGVGNLAPVFLIFLASFVPIVVATGDGVPPMFLDAGQNFGLSPAALPRRVIFPASLPQTLIGLRIALGVAWLLVVAAEMIAVHFGLGYLIIEARNANERYDLVIAGILLIGMTGLCLDSGMRRLARLQSIRGSLMNE
jgi:NitT/TauT family transport system permease protein